METPATSLPDAGPPADPRLGNKRISHTCVTCRARKVRCDGRREICANCERLGFSCSFDDGTGSGMEAADASGASRGASGGGGSVPSIPRRRARQACQNCHSRKARCSGGLPQCDRCRALGIECVYRPGKRSRMSPLSGPMASGDGGRDEQAFGRSRSESLDHDDPLSTLSTSASLDGTDREALSSPVDIPEPLAMRTFENFFRHVHHIPPFAFLHRASLMQRYRAGLVDRPLLLALVGITSLMTDLGPGTKDLGRQCIQEAETLVLGRLDKPSTPALQTLVFIIHHRILSGKFFLAFMLNGVASRLAAALRLNRENSHLCFLARESRRRLMWSLFMIDTGMANGSDDFSLWAYRADTIDIQLPCNERNFEFDLPEKTETLYPPARPPDSTAPLTEDLGFLAQHVRIRALRGRILQYAKHASSQAPTADVTSIPVHCAELAAELETFAVRLPASFQWSEVNVRLRAYSPRLCVFLMTHVWWEQCHGELYRIGLQGLQEALPASCLAQLEVQCPSFVQHCRHQVFEHARSMAEMFRLLLTLDIAVPVTDLDLPICLYQCVRLLYYVDRTSSGDSFKSQGTAVELASVCVRVLDQCIKTPATARLRTNLDQLINHGASADFAGVATTPEITDMDVDVISSQLLQPSLDTANMSATTAGMGSHMPLPSAAAGGMPKQQLPMMPPPIPDAFGNHMSVATSAAPAVTGPLDPTRPNATATAQAAPLDAFDLDIDNLGGVDFTSWFSGDWPTSDYPGPT